MNKNLIIKNSTAEFLIFQSQNKEDSIEVKYSDDMIWLSQKMMAKLFDVSIPTINEHIKNIFQINELNQNSVIRKFLITASDGKSYNTFFYNLDVIISVGYRVNSKKATQFRIWATNVLRQFAIKGYVLDKKRLDAFLQFDEREILNDVGKITSKLAKEHAESEFEKYRIIQDRLFESDFDKLVKNSKEFS